jgi:hypothetical protein
MCLWHQKIPLNLNRTLRLWQESSVAMNPDKIEMVDDMCSE